MKFDIALSDKKAASEDRTDYHLELFELPNMDGGVDQFAAVRPVSGAFMMVTNIAARAQQKAEDQLVAVLQFLDHCVAEKDIRAALLAAADKDPKQYEFVLPVDDDVFQDEELSDAGVDLVLSNKRLYGRLMNREDDLGPDTLADVMKGLVEKWSGNPTGSPRDYLPPQKRTGTRSTARSSSKASTSRNSSSTRRRGSAAPSTPSASEDAPKTRGRRSSSS